jgi:hypothetical protein
MIKNICLDSPFFQIPFSKQVMAETAATVVGVALATIALLGGLGKLPFTMPIYGPYLMISSGAFISLTGIALFGLSLWRNRQKHQQDLEKENAKNGSPTFQPAKASRATEKNQSVFTSVAGTQEFDKKNPAQNDVFTLQQEQLLKSSSYATDVQQNSEETPILEPLILEEIIFENPRKLLENTQFKNQYPILNECCCDHTPISKRKIMEKMVVDHFETQTQERKPITMVSVGCGECFQELAYLIKLIHLGYSNFHLHLIDNDPKSKEAQKELLDFMRNQFPWVNIKISPYEDVDEVDVQAIQPNLLLLIDIQGVRNPDRFREHGGNLANYSFNRFQEKLPENCMVAFIFGPTLFGALTMTNITRVFAQMSGKANRKG